MASPFALAEDDSKVRSRKKNLTNYLLFVFQLPVIEFTAACCGSKDHLRFVNATGEAASTVPLELNLENPKF